jgi:exopolysaccharide biosynthesis protein
MNLHREPQRATEITEFSSLGNILPGLSFYFNFVLNPVTMKRISPFKTFILIVFLFYSMGLFSQIPGFKKIKWEKERIAPGLVWKSSRPVLYDTLSQNINILEINLRKRKVALSYNPSRNVKLSDQVENSKALAAVNGGFFNIKEGGSVTYIRPGGKIIETDTAKRWSRNSNMTGCFLADEDGNVIIDSARTNSWYDSHQEYPEVLVTGPLLLKDERKNGLPSTTLVTVRHPRTAVGITGKHKIIFITLDGRTREARGLTLFELTDLMISLGCSDAVNLDGGGSTTMWIQGKPFNGVVNMPCDNKKFDHEGERAVSDIIVIR